MEETRAVNLVAVYPPGFLDTISAFHTADGILLFDSFMTEN